MVNNFELSKMTNPFDCVQHKIWTEPKSKMWASVINEASMLHRHLAMRHILDNVRDQVFRAQQPAWWQIVEETDDVLVTI